MAQKARDAPLVYGGTFAKYLSEWIENEGQLSAESNVAMVEVNIETSLSEVCMCSVSLSISPALESQNSVQCVFNLCC